MNRVIRDIERQRYDVPPPLERKLFLKRRYEGIGAELGYVEIVVRTMVADRIGIESERAAAEGSRHEAVAALIDHKIRRRIVGRTAHRCYPYQSPGGVILGYVCVFSARAGEGVPVNLEAVAVGPAGKVCIPELVDVEPSCKFS